MKRLLLSFSLILASVSIGLAQPSISGKTPSTHDINIAANANINILFSETMDQTSVTSSTVIVTGSQGGVYTGTFSWSSNTMIFNPDTDFFPGELVTVNVTTGVENSSNVAIAEPEVYSFMVDASGTGAFTNAGLFTAGSSDTEDVVLADIDEDGDIDVVALIPLNDQLWVFKNDGNGDFSTSTSYTTLNAQDLEAYDVDNDGDIDILTANNNAKMLSVFLNDGSGAGTFTTRNDYDNGQSHPALEMTIGDLDGDGYTDAILGNTISTPDSTKITVFFNSGSGTYPTAPDEYNVITSGMRLGAVDYDNDGHVDIVTANGTGDAIGLWNNDGTGTLLNGGTLPVGEDPYDVIFANFDDDGYIDVATPNLTTNNLTVRTENLSNAFYSQATVSAGTDPFALAAGDMDNDGDIDIVGSNSADQTVSIFSNNGFGTAFTNTAYNSLSDYTFDLKVGDVDGDDDLDVIVLTGNGFTVLKNFAGPSVTTNTPANSATDVALGSDITFKFNDAMSSGTISGNVTVSGNNVGAIAGSFSYNASDSTVTFSPTNPFPTNETITVSVTSGVENTLGEAATASSWSFTTEPIELTSFSPVRFDVDVAATSNITFSFNDDINETTANSTNILVTGSQSGDVGGTFSFDTGTNVLTFNPTADFEVGEDIFVSITTAVQSSSGQAIPQRVDWTFKVAPTSGEILASSTSFSRVGSASDVTFADINNDGDLDIITSENYNVYGFGYYENDGNGNYTLVDTVRSSGQSSVERVAVADFDQDGHLDVAIPVRGNPNSSIEVFLNDQSAAFSTSTSYTYAGTYVYGLDVGDINLDGYPDIVYVDYDNDRVSVLQNDQDGTFSLRPHVTVGVGPYYDAKLLDVDGDGQLDIISTNYDGVNISVAKGNGDGTFAARTDYSMSGSASPTFIAGGDIDGDEDLDLVVGQGSEGFTIFFNDGTGDYSTKQTVSDDAYGVSLADIDADGDLDILATNGGTVNTYLSSGTGSPTFTKSDYPFSIGGSLNSIDTGDINGDGSLDVVTHTSSNIYAISNGELVSVSSTTPTNNSDNVTSSSNITVNFNKTMDAATIVDSTVIVTGSSSGVMAKSLSLSGSTLTIDPTNNFIAGEEVRVLITDAMKSSGGFDLFSPKMTSFRVAASGNGYLAYGDTTRLQDISYSTLYQADIDGDGDIDALPYSSSEDSLLIFENNAGVFTKLTAVSVLNAERIEVVDLDNDGDMDLLVRPQSSGTLSYFLNDGNESFASAVTISTSLGTSFSNPWGVTDLNNDGYPDLYYNPGNSIFYYHLSSNGIFTSTSSTETMSGSVSSFSHGDVDGDGDIDVLAGNNSDKFVEVLFNEGGKSFSKGSSFAFKKRADVLRTADLNGDDDLDFIVMDDNTDYVFEVALGNGDGTFQTTTEYTTSGITLSTFDTGDMDGDGDLDLVFQYEDNDSGNDEYLIAYNNGSGGFGTQLTYAVPTASSNPGIYRSQLSSELKLSDVDGNGNLDILLTLTRQEVDATPSLVSENKYLVVLENSTLSSSTPTTQVSGLTVDTKTYNSASISFTAGDGDRRLIVIKQAASITQDPADNGNYTADSEFGNGSNIGDVTYVVYAGAFSSVNITGLNSETEYTVKAFEMSGLTGSEKILTTSAPSVSFTTNPPPTIWAMDADSLVFTKADNADFTQSSNYDEVTPNVWLTRGLKKGLFNYAQESAYDDNNHTSPKGTKWALGKTSDGVENLTFDTFYNTLSSNIGSNVVNADMVMYIEAEDLYVDIVFRSWTEGGGSNQGGFSYTRATGTEIANPTISPSSSAGSAVSFNGTDSKLEIKTDGFISPEGESSGGGGELKARGNQSDRIQDIGLTSSLTFEMWVKPADSSYIGGFMAFDDASSGGEGGGEFKVASSSEPFVIGIDDGNFVTSAYDENSNADSTIAGTTAVYSNQWYHVAAVLEYDYSTDGFTITMYVNGTQDGESKTLGDFNSSRDAILLGFDNTLSFDNPNYFDGEIDEFRVWRTARSADSIRTYMHRTIPSYNKDLIGYWQFNEGSGATATDVMSSEEATLTNVTWKTSSIPTGSGTTSSVSSVTTGTNTVGKAKISLTEDFDSAVDIYATEVNSDPNEFPSGYTAGVGSKYFVLELFGDPGTFSADITLTFDASDITAAMESTPSTLQLYKREGTSSGSWTSLGGATSANATTGEVTWTGITSFSQFMAVEGDPYDLIQVADDSDVVANDDSVYVFASGFFNLNDNYVDSTLTISVNTTPSNSLFIDKNANNTYDSGTDSLLESGKELDYVASGSDKLIYSSSTLGYESITVTLKSTDYTDSVPLDFMTVEARPSITGTSDTDAWYLLANPFTSKVGNMLDSVWTQGATNASTSSGTPTLYTYDESNTQWSSITGDLNATTLTTGQGLLAYLFADDDPSDGQPAQSGGWPKTLYNSGTPHGNSVSFDVNNVDVDGSTGTNNDEGWSLVGNPFGWQLSADSLLATLAREDNSANAFIYRWDATGGTWTTTSTGAIDPYESVFVRVMQSGATATLNLDEGDIHNSGNKEVQEQERFVLDLNHPTSELTSSLYVNFAENANPGLDPRDAFYIAPLKNEFASLVSKVDEQSLTVNNLPSSLEEVIEIPLHVDATVNGEFKLSWDKTQIPENWKFELVNLSTDEVIDLHDQQEMAFNYNNSMKSLVGAGQFHANNRLQGSTPQLILKIYSEKVLTSLEELADLPQEVELNQNYPNPFNPSTTIKYGVPALTNVTIEIFNVLGQRVMTLVNNELKKQGRYEIRFNASRLSSGMYFYRLMADNKIMTKQMMLIK